MIQVIRKQNCCGCSACVQACPRQCIKMQEDEEGFLYPEVERKDCVDCGMCEKVCPVVHQGEPALPLKVYAAKHPDEKIRLGSSSGGIFTLLAEKMIAEGGVVFGARFDTRWEVIHNYTETVEGLSAFRGSKYVQSSIGDSLRQAECFLKAGRKVLFSGTPCQIAGLKLFLRKEYDHLLTVDVVCHGVPSPLVWKRYLRESIQGKDRNVGAVYGIDFRDKSTGWKEYSVTFRGNGKILFTEPARQNLFMRGFLADLYLRPSCHACPAKCFKSSSDITLGDFWGVQRFFGEYDDDRGVSAIMVNTGHGHHVLKKCGLCGLKETDYRNVLMHNISMEKSVLASEKRQLFFAGLDENSVLSLIDRFTYVPWYGRLIQWGKWISKFLLRKIGKGIRLK